MLLCQSFLTLEVRNQFDCLLHFVLRILFHGIADRSVNIHREGAAEMPQLALHTLDGASRLQCQNRTAMSQVMEHMRDTTFFSIFSLFLPDSLTSPPIKTVLFHPLYMHR